MKAMSKLTGQCGEGTGVEEVEFTKNDRTYGMTYIPGRDDMIAIFDKGDDYIIMAVPRIYVCSF